VTLWPDVGLADQTSRPAEFAIEVLEVLLEYFAWQLEKQRAQSSTTEPHGC
jgi:hypothetical protein